MVLVEATNKITEWLTSCGSGRRRRPSQNPSRRRLLSSAMIHAGKWWCDLNCHWYCLRKQGPSWWSTYLPIILSRSADIALVAGGSRKRWIIATENMKAGDTILNSNHIGRMAGERWLLDAWDGGCRRSSANEILSCSGGSGGQCISSWSIACGDPHQQCGKWAWPRSTVYPSCRYGKESTHVPQTRGYLIWLSSNP